MSEGALDIHDKIIMKKDEIPVITSVGLETLKGIKAGYTSNHSLAEALGATPAKWGSRVTRLRKQGLVLATRDPKHINSANYPLLYEVIKGKKYIVSDTRLKHPSKADKVPKTYREMGEDMYDNLDFYIYPRHYQQFAGIGEYANEGHES